jgi:pimeloyl-ACP methyl ester carboxylesterase
MLVGMMTEKTTACRHLDRPGGRRVAGYELTPDAPAGAPVVLFCHAAPGSGHFDPDPAVTAARGVRLISLDRPGYGGSDPLRDEFATVASAADDAAALLDDLLPAGVKATVVGWSAGGRVALALAARRPDRVGRVAVLGTPAPDEEVAWVPAEHRDGLAALRGRPPAVVHAALGEAFAPVLATLTGPARLGLVGAGDADAAVLADADVAERLEGMLERALEQGAVGMAADIAGYVLAPWGFEPGEVRVPVLLGYGLEDTTAGVEHGHWWAGRLPDATLDEIPGAGHLLVVPHWRRTLDHLLAPL